MDEHGILDVDEERRYDWKKDKKLSLAITSNNKNNKLMVNEGDFVRVLGASKNEIYVAKIKWLRRNGDEKQAGVRWFFLPSEMPKHKLKNYKVGKQELFYDAQRRKDIIDAETIVGKCKVSWLAQQDSFQQKSENAFFFKCGYNGRSICPLNNDLSEAKPINVSTEKKSVQKTKKVENTKKINYDIRQQNAYETPSKKDDLVEKTTLISPVNAVSYGRFDASFVALEMLQDSDENEDSKEIVAKQTTRSRLTVKKLPQPKIKNEKETKNLLKTTENHLNNNKRKSVAVSRNLRTRFGEVKQSLRRSNIKVQKLTVPLNNKLFNFPQPTFDHDENKSSDGDNSDHDSSVKSLSSSESNFEEDLMPAKPLSSKKVNNINTSKNAKNENSDSENSSFKSLSSSESDNEDEIILARARSKKKSISTLKLPVPPSLKKLNNFKLSKYAKKAESDRGESDDSSFKSLTSSESDFEDEPARTRSQKKSTSNNRKSLSVKKVNNFKTPINSKTSQQKSNVTPIVIKMPGNATPYIRARPTPRKTVRNNLGKARTLLHVSVTPESLPCREEEFQEIFCFVQGMIESGGGGCMYVSGVPGTGKTATVNEVMENLQAAAADKEIPNFLFAKINGMSLTEPRQAYVQLLQQITGEKVSTNMATEKLTNLFSQRRKQSIVLLADELDLLWTKKQDVMYHLFDWPTNRHARFIVVAVANTMDLPERMLMNRVASRLGLTRLTFKPYTFKQLQEIVATRLQGLDVFEPDAIQLVSRKVAAVSGDARRCLDICRRATEIAEKKDLKRVTIENVHAALQEMFATPMVKAIRSASCQEQMFLRATVAEFRRLGIEEATLGQITVQHKVLTQLQGLPPISNTTIHMMACNLSTCRLILMEGGRRDLYARIRLNLSVDDVLFALDC